MKKYLLILVGFVLSFGCKEKESVITIVNIEHLDRSGIAKQLKIIDQYAPKVIGLDFLLTTDSLNKDTLLSKVISNSKNMVQASRLHNYDERLNRWDSIEKYHPKFRFGDYAFSNITTTDDSVFVRELPMRQYYRNETVFAFSYLIASNYDSRRVNEKYKNGDKDFYFDKSSFERHFKLISVKDLMTGNFDKNDLKDKIVLLGHVGDNEDMFYLDDKGKGRISGVEIHASIIEQIIN
jgi:CHASE2 domain-containing sensor protein